MANELVAQHIYTQIFEVDSDKFVVCFAVIEGEVLTLVSSLEGPLGYTRGSITNSIGPWSRSKAHAFDGDRDAPLVRLPGPTNLRNRFFTPDGVNFVCNGIPKARGQGLRQSFFTWYKDRAAEILKREEYLFFLKPLKSLNFPKVKVSLYALESREGKVVFVGFDSSELAKALAYKTDNTLAYMVCRAETYRKKVDYLLIDEERLPPGTPTYRGMSLGGVARGVCLINPETAVAIARARRKPPGDYPVDTGERVAGALETLLPNQKEEDMDVTETVVDTDTIKQTPDPSPVTFNEESVVYANSEESDALTKKVRMAFPDFGKITTFDDDKGGFVGLSLGDFNKILSVALAVNADASPDLDVPDVESLPPMEAIHTLSGVLTKAPEMLEELNKTKEQWSRQAERVEARIQRIHAIQKNGVAAMTDLLSKVD